MADDQISEVVRLCEGYSIVSQYASFLVLENDAEYQRWQIARRNATRVQRDRGAQVALRQKLDEMQRQASAQLGPRQPADTVAAVPRLSRRPHRLCDLAATRPSRRLTIHLLHIRRTPAVFHRDEEVVAPLIP